VQLPQFIHCANLLDRFPEPVEVVCPSYSQHPLPDPKLAQISVALISLMASADGGTNYNGTYTRTGIVHAPDISCYFHNQICPRLDLDLIMKKSNKLQHTPMEICLSARIVVHTTETPTC
jgi:hypothetical protein